MDRGNKSMNLKLFLLTIIALILVNARADIYCTVEGCEESAEYSSNNGSSTSDTICLDSEHLEWTDDAWICVQNEEE